MQEDPETPAPTVLPSSTELFYFYGQTLEQCGKYTTGEPMKKLADVFARYLKIYSGMLPRYALCFADGHQTTSCFPA